MPKRAKEMSALEVKRLEHPGKGRNVTFAVGGVSGLLLQITPSDAKSWLLRYVMHDKRREMGLGPYPDVTLAQARDRAREARDAIWRGLDPVEEKQAKATPKQSLTFAKAVDKFLAAKLDEFRNEKHRKQWRATLDTYAAETLGKMPVAEIDVHDVLKTLTPIWSDKTETASRLRGRIESVLAWATVSGHRTGDNPARWKGNLDAILPKPGKVAKSDNHPALALNDAGRWFAELRKREGMGARALEFLAMTAARSGEVRGATWGEIDTDAAVWTIPAARMKAGKEHRVPLTAEAVALLAAIKPADQREADAFIFPAAKGGALSDMTVSAVMRRMQEDEEKAGRVGFLDPRNKRPAVPHGLRSTFRDWAAERTEYPRDMAEISLAHNVGSEVERAYRRGDMIEKRRAMMAAWGRFLRSEVAPKVVKLEARA
jgi:integrase